MSDTLTREKITAAGLEYFPQEGFFTKNGKIVSKTNALMINKRVYSLRVIAWILMTGQAPKGKVQSFIKDRYNLKWDSLYETKTKDVPLTQERLKKMVTYDPLTGLFTKYGVACEHKDSFGYTKVFVDGKLFWTHRLAWLYMTGEWPQQYIDHIDRDPSNNRWTNLRDVSQSQNMLNQRRHPESCVFYRGNYWVVSVKNKYYGCFSDKELATQKARQAIAENLMSI